MNEEQQARFDELEQKWVISRSLEDKRAMEHYCYHIRYEREREVKQKEEARLRALEKEHNIRILRKHEQIDTSAWEGVR